MSLTTLTNMVKTYAQSQFLTENGIPEDALKYTMKVYLTRLENNEDKLELARMCMNGGLKTRDLKRRIKEICDQSANISVSPGVAMKQFLTRVERWIRGTHTPDG
ncbi:MAG: hypothetical protein Q7U02_06285, partial [Desulfosalsimonadaceae bacterium]|nr:hypothetical protein [Desulfosalsimonadaceae bacterium]